MHHIGTSLLSEARSRTWHVGHVGHAEVPAIICPVGFVDVRFGFHFLVGSLTSVQSFVRLGPSLPLAAASQSRDLVSLKNFYLVGLAFFTYGKVRADSTMSILDHVTSESALFLRSFSRLDLALLAFDCSSIGFFISLRSLARLGFAVSITGLACIESFLLAFEAMHMGSSMFARSPARPDLAAFLVDTYQLGFCCSDAQFCVPGIIAPSA